MKQKIKRVLYHLRHPERLLRYLKWIVDKARPFLPSLCLLTGIEAAMVLVGFVSSFISKHVVDSATAGRDFAAAFIIMIAVSFISIFINSAVSLASTLINEKFSFSVRLKVFSHILDGDYLQLSRFHSGDLLTRLTSDAGTVAGGIASAFPSLLMILFRLLMAFIILFRYTPFLAISALLLAPVGLLMSMLLGEKLKQLSVEVKECEAAYRSFMQESLANITVVKSFCAEGRSGKEMNRLRKRTLDATLRRARLSVAMNICIRLLFNLGYFIAFGYCLTGLFRGSLSYGTMTLFLSLFSQIQQPIMSLSHLIPQCVGMLASAGRVMELEDVPADRRCGMQDTFPALGLRFDHVNFAYGRKAVLQNVSFNAYPGERIGIMGPSGAGKTTLIRLVLSLLTPDSGSVEFFCGDSVEPASADSRRHIAYVPQGNSLLSGTIADNLRYGNPDAGEAEMWEALHCAAADFVRTLPDGLDTRLGEKASGLSEGQAQRIAIARALLRRTPVLILDEATSALDEATEKTVLSNLAAGGAHHPLCLIITHRRSMLPYFDRLIEIDGGKAHMRSLG